jgi:tetratricopeptide (TPR) repeat protein
MKLRLGITLLFFLSTFTSVYSQSFESGVEQFESGDYLAAKQTFNSIQSSDKNNPQIYFYLGRVEFELDKYGDAVKQFEKASDLDSDNSYYYMWLGHAFGRQAQEASVLRQAGHARNSRRNYEKAIEMDPSNIEARESAMEYYMQAPRFVGGGRDKAENQANEIEQIDLAAGISAWGRIYSYHEETENALNHYNSAIENNPELMAPYYGLYSMYFNQGEFSKAAEVSERQLQVNDTTANIYYNLGNAQQRDGSFDEALENYYKSLELDEEFNLTYYQVGRLAAVSGQHLEVGKEYINSFIELGSEVGDSWLAWAHYRLGAIEEHMDSTESAISNYEKALEYDKDLDQAKQALNALK